MAWRSKYESVQNCTVIKMKMRESEQRKGIKKKPKNVQQTANSNSNVEWANRLGFYDVNMHNMDYGLGVYIYICGYIIHPIHHYGLTGTHDGRF